MIAETSSRRGLIAACARWRWPTPSAASSTPARSRRSRTCERVATLVEGDLAEHWQRVGRLPRPRRRGLAEAAGGAGPGRRPAERRVAPAAPAGRSVGPSARRPRPVIAAGSTGTAPAAADLLAAVAARAAGLRRPARPRPRAGRRRLGDARRRRTASAGRPEAAAGRAAASTRATSGPGSGPPSRRRRGARPRPPAADQRGPAPRRGHRRLARRSSRRCARTPRRGSPPTRSPQGLEGLSVVTVRTEEEAAAVVALLMRETLETPGRTCALVTPDQALARRVAARLARWGVVADVLGRRSRWRACRRACWSSSPPAAIADPLDPADPAGACSSIR